ncbi:MAG: hypothetical protein AAF658_17635, partial [Myxococcota bacterium]
ETGCEPRDCLAELVDAIGSDQVVTGRVTRLGGTTAIALRVIDLRERSLLASSTRQLTASHGEGILAAIGPMVDELFPSFALRRGESSGVAPALQERWDPKPLSPTLFWTGVAVTAARAAVATGFGLQAVSKRNDFDDLVASSSLENPASGTEVVAAEEDYENARDLSNIFWITTGVTAVGTAVIGLMTDFGDDASIGVVPLENGVAASAGFRF